MSVILLADWLGAPTWPVVAVPRSQRTGFLVHWDGGRNPAAAADEVELLRAYHRHHLAREDKPGGFLYNLAVGPVTGNVYLGRGIDVLGAHAGGVNRSHLGVLLIGGPGNLTPAARRGLRAAYALVRETLGHDITRQVHSDVNATGCPGDDIAAWVHAGGLTTGEPMVTERELRDWLPWTPSDDKTWYFHCQRLVSVLCEYFGVERQRYDRAIYAYNAAETVIQSRVLGSAPAGAVEWWAWDDFGHVGLALGGGRTLMTSARNITFDEVWAEGAGVVDVGRFTRETGLRYLGWSYTNGRNTTPTIGIGEEFTMAQYEAIMAALDNIQKLLADTGPDLLDPNWKAGHGSVLYHLQNLTGQVVERTVPDPTSPGKTKVAVISKVQDDADTNTMVRDLVARGPVDLTDAQLDKIAEKIAKKTTGASAKDIAAAVREVFRTVPLT